MQMKVDRACGRCGRVKTVEVDLKGAQEIIHADQKKKEAFIALEDFASKLNPTIHPEIIIFTRNTGGYELNTLDNLCKNSESKKRARGCAPRVESLLNDILNRNVKKTPKKPKEKKEG